MNRPDAHKEPAEIDRVVASVITALVKAEPLRAATALRKLGWKVLPPPKPQDVEKNLATTP